MFNKSAFVGEKNLDVIKMHGTTMEKNKKTYKCISYLTVNSQDLHYENQSGSAACGNSIMHNVYSEIRTAVLLIIILWE